MVMVMGLEPGNRGRGERGREKMGIGMRRPELDQAAEVDEDVAGSIRCCTVDFCARRSDMILLRTVHKVCARYNNIRETSALASAWLGSELPVYPAIYVLHSGETAPCEGARGPVPFRRESPAPGEYYYAETVMAVCTYSPTVRVELHVGQCGHVCVEVELPVNC